MPTKESPSLDPDRFFGWEVDMVWWPVAAKPNLKTKSHIQQECGSSGVESSLICTVASQKNTAAVGLL